ncbi:hypothetical protein Clacol_004743 [Clathrus columnatus]|uniref:HNH nuclease domain-containing protein n=1 Tax=Clathrus columnatus TaxID=1419009 RepID=A0AAV5A7B9_9AGAM|nr:hypothetical protein Clacol_004743 [Clathrus columnatus]
MPSHIQVAHQNCRFYGYNTESESYEALFGLHQHINNNNGTPAVEWSWREVDDIIRIVVDFVVNPHDIETYTIRQISLQFNDLEDARGFPNDPDTFIFDGAPADKTLEDAGLPQGTKLSDDIPLHVLSTSRYPRQIPANPPERNPPVNPGVQRYVRARDNECCISGEPVVGGDYTRFQVAHIFERANSNKFQADGWDNRVLGPSSGNSVFPKNLGPNNIDSPRNLLLLRADIHLAFDQNCIEVNRQGMIKVFNEGYDEFRRRNLAFHGSGRAQILRELLDESYEQKILRNYTTCKDIRKPNDLNKRIARRCSINSGSFPRDVVPFHTSSTILTERQGECLQSLKRRSGLEGEGEIFMLRFYEFLQLVLEFLLCSDEELKQQHNILAVQKEAYAKLLTGVNGHLALSSDAQLYPLSWNCTASLGV